MNLDLLYAILIALIFVCIFILFSKFSVLNTAITAIVFYMLYNVIFTAEDDNDTIIISNGKGIILGGNQTKTKTGSNEANHIDDLKEPEDNIEINLVPADYISSLDTSKKTTVKKSVDKKTIKKPIDKKPIVKKSVDKKTIKKSVDKKQSK